MTMTGGVSYTVIFSGSLSFTGSPQGVGTTATIGGPFDLATGAPNWTVECWFYLNSFTTNQVIFSKGGITGVRVPSYSLTILSTGFGQWVVGNNLAGGAIQTIPTAFLLNTWYHFALVRNGQVLTAYVNGVGGTPIVMSFLMSNLNGNQFTIGKASDGNTNAYLNGYISTFRIVKNAAVYTGNFTVPASPLNITQPAGTNISAINLTAPAYSVSFDSGSYLSIPDNAVFDMGSGNFTFETWIYPTSLTQQGIILAKTNDASEYGQYELRLNTDGTLVLYVSTNGTTWDITLTTAVALLISTWYHIAVTRNTGGVFTIWINGTSSATVTNNLTIWTATWPITIGNYRSGTSTPYTGFLSNYRIVKGIAVYTGTFTPSTIPLTSTQSANVNGNPSAAITGTETSLLTCQNSTFVDNSSYAFTITATGSPTTNNTSAPPFGIASLLLDTPYNSLFLTDGSYYNTALTNTGSVTGVAWNPFTVTLSVKYLVVAGGGGGGGYIGGGGGAGGYRTVTTSRPFTIGTSYTVTVGAGGAAGVTNTASGTQGGDSVFDTITSAGGGGGGIGGGGTGTAPTSGGSGGGGASSSFLTGGDGNTPSTSPVQGYAGGVSPGAAENYPSAGGGGSSAVGQTPGSTSAIGGNGGAGTSNSITGTAVTYAVGGGGAAVTGGGSGSADGGGHGGEYDGSGNYIGGTTAGTVNTGNGGGAGGWGTNGGENIGTGGSGIVILQVLNYFTGTLSGGLTYTLSTAVSGYNTYIVTAGTGTITFS